MRDYGKELKYQRESNHYSQSEVAKRTAITAKFFKKVRKNG